MANIPYSTQELWEIITYLARKENKSQDEFISAAMLEIQREKEEKMSEFVNLFSTLDDAQKKRLLSQLGGSIASEEPASALPAAPQTSPSGKKYLLSQLKDLEVADLVKSKPTKIWINGGAHEVKNWKEVTLNFVKALISHNLLHKEDLPFYPSSASRKAYVNSSPNQPHSAYDGLFEKADEGFYVDIKHNAKYHVLNIWRSLEKLGLLDKWNVELELRD